jgi:hypothetical protein
VKDIYVDRFVKFNISQGVARLDFARVEDIDAEKKEMQLSPSARLVMPLDSFSHFVDQLVKVKTEMQKRADSAAAMQAEEKPADTH